MSAEVLALAIGPSLGAFLGSLTGVAGLRWWQDRRNPGKVSDASVDADRKAIEATFATHATAVARQVAAFADQLAEGDPVLRNRLRQLERPVGGGLQ